MHVAEHLGWNEDWLNDGAKGFLHTQSVGPVVYQTDGICVLRPATAQLLAMKLSAWRDDTDISDASLLLKAMDQTKIHEVWEECDPYLPDTAKLKARYALEDLWNDNH